MTSPTRCTLAAAFMSAATCLAVLPAAAQSVENFYKSHELTILIGHPPGGSCDFCPRNSPPPLSAIPSSKRP